MAPRGVHYLLIAVCCMIFLCGGIYYYNSDKINKLIRFGESTPADNSVLESEKEIASKRYKNKLITKQDDSSTAQHIAQQQGYVVPFRLYEQQTMAARNLWHLQYWANTVNMKVVEPFVSNATFTFLPLVDGVSNPMRFGDLYDKDFWNNQATNNSCAGLVTWEEFLLNAPKNAILVLPWGSSKDSIRIEIKPDKIHGNRRCDHAKFPRQALEFFRKLGFHFVREVCILFSPSATLSTKQFSHYILDKFSSNNVTVIFGHWQGIAKSRVNIEAPRMRLLDTVHVALIPSAKMIKSSEEYVESLPRGDSGKYYGVMVRVEKAYKRPQRKSGYTADEVMKHMKDCATSLAQHFKTHPKWGRSLAIDVGQYGSLGMRKSADPTEKKRRQALYEAFFTTLYGSSWTINDFEDSFKTYFDMDNAVVVAQLQRTIAAKSDCIVLIGGGSSFQTSALEMYKRFHPNEQEQCIIKHCYQGRINLLNIPHGDN